MVKTSNILVDTLQLEKSGLLRFLRHRLGCPDAADDVYQAMSENIHSIPQAATITQPSAYLFKAAANAANSHLRAEKAREHYETAAAEQQESTDFRNPERVTLGENALEVVEAALAELPVLTRQMFVASRVHSETQEDIAKRYGVSLSTVEKRIAKATSHCHQRLRSVGFTVTTGKPRLIHDRSQDTGEP